MLLANPHLLWGGSHTWFEAQFKSPEYDIYGATLVGLPVMRIGFNQRLGWVHTVNTQDGCDLYQLKLSGQQYLLDGVARDFDTKRETMYIRQPDGSLQAEQLTLRRAEQGPVFDKDGQSYALRIVGVDQLQTPGVLEQWWDMAQAPDFKAFRKVVARLRSLPQHHLRRRSAQYLGGLWRPEPAPRRRRRRLLGAAGGRQPRRSDLAPGAAPGRIAAGAQPGQRLGAELNSVPWYMSKPALDPAAYAAYLSPRASPLLREQRGIELIEQTLAFTLDTLLSAKHDTRLLLADGCWMI